MIIIRRSLDDKKTVVVADRSQDLKLFLNSYGLEIIHHHNTDFKIVGVDSYE